MRRPLIGITVVYILGTLLALKVSMCGRVSPELLAWPVVFFFLVWLFLAARHGKSKSEASGRANGCLLVCLSVLFSAWFVGGIRIRMREGQVTQALPGPGVDVYVEGTIREDPFFKPAGKGGGAFCRFPLEVTAIRGKTGKWEAASGRWYVTLYGSGVVNGALYGEEWCLSGRVRSTRTVGNVHEAAFLTGSARHAVRMRSAPGHLRVMQKIYSGRRAARDLLSRGIEGFEECRAVIDAIVLGYRQGLTKEMRQRFSTTGTLHIFAISGLHVGIIALFVITVLKAFRISRTRWVFFMGPVLLVYTLATGARASAVRACITAIIYYLAPVFRRKADAFSTLALAALLILCAAPGQLIDAGFVLSFTVVAGLLLLYPEFAGRMRKWIKEDEFLVLNKEERGFFSRNWWRRRVHGGAASLISLVAMCVSAWLVSTPLIACFFGSLSLVALLGNVLVIPIAFLIVLTGSLSLVVGSVWSPVGEVFNHANVLLVRALLGTMEGLSHVPMASIRVHGIWDAWWVVAWYGILAVILFVLATRRGTGVAILSEVRNGRGASPSSREDGRRQNDDLRIKPNDESLGT